ncbi:MAG: thiamine-phosphate kinase [Proteobacteria bacterium]|nr:thiamine-phosphate kinase [Pseudomonadota bacterium]
MFCEHLKKALRFYFITDDSSPTLNPLEQTHIAIRAGAGIIQYRNKFFSSVYYDEAKAIRDICRCNCVFFIVNDNILLAKLLKADGVHLGQNDEPAPAARRILGSNAIIGISVSNTYELYKTNLSECDYIGTGPVFATSTKKDAKKATGLSGLKSVTEQSPVPVVAIGGIDDFSAPSCFDNGAAGVAVISSVSRAFDPMQNALKLGAACSSSPRSFIESPWSTESEPGEFGLIEKLIKAIPVNSKMLVSPGDDACLLTSLSNPVITTDTQREGVHFSLNWQTPEEIGIKAVEVTLSDLAASYARPVSLFINLCLPAYVSGSMIEEIYKGALNTLNKYDCALAGGNVSSGSELALDLFAVGEASVDIFPKRSNAKPGYGLYCTGPLGLASAGLELLKNNDPAFSDLVSKFKFPKVRFDAAQILAEAKIDCVMDISDGLSGDAGHIAKASGVTIELDLKSCPVSSSLLSYCQKYEKNPKELIANGGEDYELLFACHPDIYKSIADKLNTSFQVGTCLLFNGKHILSPFKTGSFQHGRKS